ncbi:hypothetical protein PAPYR_13469 [Paratrimastix pyriformis]|uniref:Uncharacterized protein n=1 Tax=Paratrimastix pyriformis TaxID=342808 RepID=A0ABQ8U092_9EUKA|nr:hypothetical protein PAPYR_13469 [Paratrimastix pyriformis]
MKNDAQKDESTAGTDMTCQILLIKFLDVSAVLRACCASVHSFLVWENEEEEQDEAPTDRYIYPPLLNLYFQQAQPLPDLEGPDLPLAPTHPKELTPDEMAAVQMLSRSIDPDLKATIVSRDGKIKQAEDCMLAALRPLQTITALAHLSEAQHESHASFTLVRNTTLIAAQAIKEAVRAILDLRRSEFRPFLNLEAAIEDDEAALFPKVAVEALRKKATEAAERAKATPDPVRLATGEVNHFGITLSDAQDQPLTIILKFRDLHLENAQTT